MILCEAEGFVSIQIVNYHMFCGLALNWSFNVMSWKLKNVCQYMYLCVCVCACACVYKDCAFLPLNWRVEIRCSMKMYWFFPLFALLVIWHLMKKSCSKVADPLRATNTILRMKLGYCFCNMQWFLSKAVLVLTLKLSTFLWSGRSLIWSGFKF